MQRGKKLQDYIGKNEKTKLVVKIQKVRAISANMKQVFLLYRIGIVFVFYKLNFNDFENSCPPFVAVPFRKGRGHQQESR